MKTIIFSTDPKEIEKYGSEVIIAKDPIKTLKAMKKLGNKEEYKVVGEDKYVEVAQKMGYNKKASDEELIKLVGKLATEHERQLKEKEEVFTGEISKIKSEHEQKLRDVEDEKLKLKTEYEQKLKQLEREKLEIKKTIQRIVYEPD